MKATIKRINVNLTQEEVTALAAIEEEYVTRGWKYNEAEVVRDAIKIHAQKEAGSRLKKQS